MIKKLKTIVSEKRLNVQSFLRKVRLHYTLDKRDVEHLSKSYHCRKKWYGNSYGGFYINPDLLNEKSVVYSFGIGKDISFDKCVMRNHQCNVFGFDPTPKSIEYIRSLAPNALFHFYDYGIATTTRTEKFFLPVNKKGVSGSMTLHEFVNQDDYIEVKMKSLDEIAKSLGHTKIDVLKMDIEGAEYDVLESLLSCDLSITQLLVEFHDRLFDGEIKSKRIVKILKERGFEIFGVSLNYEEVSFINTKDFNRT